MRLSRILLAALFVLAGVAHFVRRDSFVGMVPTWLPNAALLVALSGIAEVAGGIGLLVPAVRRGAGWGLVALLIAVFPANIHMLADARASGASAAWQTALWIRLPLQPLLVWWVWRAAIRTTPVALLVALSVTLSACSQPAPGADHTAVDTLVGIAPGPVEVKALDSVASPRLGVRPGTAAPGTTADTGAIIASADELTALGRSMIIPVQGITLSDLHDTYTEARAGHTHEALDIRAARGTPVLSAIDGRVMKLHSSVAGGLMVYAADPSDRFILMYGHLDRYADGLAAGMPVKQGQVIGYVGTTGNAPIDTPHLHFALARGHPSVAWWKGTPINPFPLLAAPH